LKEVFEQYRAQTEVYAKRLDEAFELLEVRAQKLPSAAIRGLIEDADWVAKNILGDAAIDVGLVAALQAIQHYKLALYGAAFEWAKLLDIKGVVDLLEETMHDSDEGLEALDELAGSKINEEALQDEEADEDDDSAEEEDENEEEDED